MKIKYLYALRSAIILGCTTIAFSGSAQAGLIEVEQVQAFDFAISPGATLNNQATNGQTFVFQANPGGRTDSVSFNQADAGLGTLVGVKLGLASTTLADLNAQATHFPGATLAPQTTYSAQSTGFFAVESSLGMLIFQQPIDVLLSCTLDMLTPSCATTPEMPTPFNGSANASQAELASFLGAGVFSVGLEIDGPTLRTELTGNGLAGANNPNSWSGALTLTYTFQTMMPPNPVPVPQTLYLILAGVLLLHKKKNRQTKKRWLRIKKSPDLPRFREIK